MPDRSIISQSVSEFWNGSRVNKIAKIAQLDQEKEKSCNFKHNQHVLPCSRKGSAGTKIIAEYYKIIYITFSNLISSATWARNCWEASEDVNTKMVGYIENGWQLRHFSGCNAL